MRFALSFKPRPRESLLEGDVARHMKRMAVPLMWGFFAMNSFSVVDALYISRLGTASLAAFGFTIPVVMFFMGIIYGFAVGTTAVLARLYGEGDFPRIQRLTTDSAVLTVLTVIAAAGMGELLNDPVFRLMGAGEDVMPQIRGFMHVWYAGMVFAGILFVSNAAMRAEGDTRTPSILLAGLSLMNAIIDPFLIYGWGPFPQMGLTGAAVTLVISYALCGVVALRLMALRGLLRTPLFHEHSVQSWRRILKVAVPSMISNVVLPVSQAAVTFLAAEVGTEAVAALGVATRIEGMVIMVFYAMGASVSIFVGQNFGAGNYGRVRDMIALGCRLCIYWSLAFAVLLYLGAAWLPLFFDKDPQVVAFTAEYLRLVPVSYGPLGVMVIVNAAFNPVGKPVAATVMILLRAVVLYVPLAWVGQRYLGFAGIALALAVTNVATGTIARLWNNSVVPR